jgi:methionyl-tRNA synthetase
MTVADQEVIREISNGFDTVGGLIERASFQQAIKEALRLSSLANGYLAVEEPWKVIKNDRERAGTVLNVGLHLVDALKLIFAPFLPFTSQQVHEMLGHDGFIAGPLDFREVTEEGGRTHRVLTGDYASWVGSWRPPELPVGQRLREPRPIFKKLDLEQVLADEA